MRQPSFDQVLLRQEPEVTSLAATPATRRRPVVERIAGWSARHRKTAVFGWLLLVAVVFLAGQALGTKSVPPYDPGQSGQAQRALQQITGDYQPAPTENVLIQGGTGGLRDHAARAVEAALRGVPSSAADVRGPRLSADGRSELVTFTVPGKAADTTTTVQAAQQAVAAVQARYPGLTVAESGDASISGAVSTALGHDFHKAEETSVPITLLLLLVVFGSLIAAGIPLLLAITAVMAAISLLSVVGQWLPVGSSTSEVVLLTGMAVGIEYSLFYLRREREARARGASHAEALRIAAGTSGKAVLISGLTVMVALAGLFLTGLSIFDGVALGSIAVVGIAVVGSLTVLPAVLSWLGPRLERGRVPLLRRRARATRPSRLWGALARQVVKHPLAWGGIASLALLALAAPALGMRIGYPAIDAPKGLPVVQTMDRIERAFPQGPSPAEVVVTGKDLGGPAVRHAVEALRGRATASGPIRGPISAVPVAGDRALLISVPLAGDGSDSASANALATLRNQVLPSTLGTVPGVSFAVTGDTASNVDFNQQMRSEE